LPTAHFRRLKEFGRVWSLGFMGSSQRLIELGCVDDGSGSSKDCS
jgi:hypothetical protein